MVFNETSGEQPVLEIERRLADAAEEAWPDHRGPRQLSR
jgi:hypothetical protein